MTPTHTQENVDDLLRQLAGVTELGGAAESDLEEARGAELRDGWSMMLGGTLQEAEGWTHDDEIVSTEGIIQYHRSGAMSAPSPPTEPELASEDDQGGIEVGHGPPILSTL